MTVQNVSRMLQFLFLKMMVVMTSSYILCSGLYKFGEIYGFLFNILIKWSVLKRLFFAVCSITVFCIDLSPVLETLAEKHYISLLLSVDEYGLMHCYILTDLNSYL